MIVKNKVKKLKTDSYCQECTNCTPNSSRINITLKPRTAKKQLLVHLKLILLPHKTSLNDFNTN